MPRRRSTAARTALALLFVALLAFPLASGSATRPGPTSARTTAPSVTDALTVHRAPALTAPAARSAVALPAFSWGLAYIIYGPNDDATRFMGEGAATVVDDHLRNITTFGGLGTGGLSNWTVNYNSSQGYFNVTTPLPNPSARTNVSFAPVPGRDFAVLFGGLTDLRHQSTASDTWVYYFANQSWFNVTHAVAPPARQSAAFAVNASGNSALLEGGWNPSYTVNGSTAAVIWNDTWSLNLTTFDWVQLHPAAAPPPLFGSGLIWQNATHRFDLFGGCALLCSSDLWSYGGVPANWVLQPTTNAPPPRASSAFVWDGPNHMAILQGGFSWGGGGATALGDGYLFSPTSLTWYFLNAGSGPGPRYDAANAWANFPGCVGLNFLGGNISLAGPPANVSLLSPLGANATNCFPNLIAGGGSPPPPPCSVGSVPLQLRVTDASTGLGISSALVSILGQCISQSFVTNAQGYLNTSLPAPDFINFSASATGYHDNSLGRRFLPNTTNVVQIPLSPDPSLSVRAWGVGVGGVRVPLANVTVQQAQFRILGQTGPTGWLNISQFSAPTGPLLLGGSLVNFSSASTPINVPYSGLVRANLTLDAAGELDIHIVDGATGRGLPAINEQMRDLDRRGPAFSQFSVDANGWYNVSTVPASNYSISANAVGYATNTTSFDHPWILRQVVVLNLTAELGAVVDALVRDTTNGNPIGGATVKMAGWATVVTDSHGWANFSGIKPPGLFQVLATATGYSSNYTVVSLTYYQRLVPYYIDMMPLPPCPGSPGCPPVNTPHSGPAFGYLTSGGGVGILLLATPAALLAAGLLYAILVARRPARSGRSPAASAPTGR